MSTIVTRAGKGSALTHAEVDANFTNLNNAAQTVFLTTAITLTNQTSALSDFAAPAYTWFELSTAGRFNRIRLNCYVGTSSASANTPIIFLQYSTDTSTWTTIGSGSGGDVISLASTGVKATDWITLPAGAVGIDIYFRVAMQGGDGVADPAVRSLAVSFEWA